MYFPDPLPDENFYSLICRIALINGLEKNRQACIQLFGLSRIGSVTGCPIDWQHFCRLCDCLYGTSYEALSQLTTHCYFCFLNWPAKMQGGKNVLLSSHFPQNIPYAYLGKDENYRWRFCKTCMETDFRHHRVSYWHLSHQLPSTFVCSKHLSILHEVSLPKILRNTGLFLPSDDEVQERAAFVSSPPLNAATLVHLAVLGERILASPTSQFSASEIFATLLDASTERGLTTACGSIRWPYALQDFEQKYLRNRAIPSTQIDDLGTSVLQAIAGKYRADNWLARTMLIDWTLGSFDALTQRVSWLRSMNPNAGAHLQQEVEQRRNATTTNDRERHRQICIDTLGAGSHRMRSELSRKAYASYRWLLSHDIEWLNEHCKSDNQAHQFELF